MAIGFGRIEFIKRSAGRNACQISAYLSRSRVAFKGNCALDPKVYNFSKREKASYHEVILPKGANENLKIPEVLWNLAEKKEVRKDAQVCMHMVLALPDDREIGIADKIDLTKTFVKRHFPGIPAEFVVHPPERIVEITEESETIGVSKGSVGKVVEEKDGKFFISFSKSQRGNTLVEIGKEYKGMSITEHNWHAHVLLATRRLKENGCEFEDKKANDLMPTIRKGKVIDGFNVGKCWASHQNEFFLSKGLALRVEENGLVSQEHLGPVRMRGRAFSLLEEHERRSELNMIFSSDPRKILSGITKTKSVFSQEDVERFISKHVPGEKIQEVREGFWKLGEIVQLRDLGSKEFVSQFTSKAVIGEEEHILRIAERIFFKETKTVSQEIRPYHVVGLNEEQCNAYYQILGGKGISCVQGYAGTGKSHLLKALKGAYEEEGLTVRAFGPDNATANVLQGKGFSNAENVYRFLFSAKHGYRNLRKGGEVWFLDEAGKIGNRPLLELLKFAERKDVKLVLAGDSKQLPPVERGGLFKHFCARYGSFELSEIRRQKEESARSMAKNLAQGKIGQALDWLCQNGGLVWSSNRKEAMEGLVMRWAQDHRGSGNELLAKDSSLIVAGTNDEVRVLNELVRGVRKQRGELGGPEFGCETFQGKVFISEGDRIEFRKNDRDLNVTNGLSGVLLRAAKNRFSVAVQEQGKKTRVVIFDPEKYHSFQLGYASTCSRAQGKTVQRAYFLHSQHLNKQMAYVGLTRHIKDVSYFVSKEDASSLSDLKRQALRDGIKPTTLEYTTTSKIKHEASLEKHKFRLNKLKNSERFSDRLKGGTLSFLDRFHTKFLNVVAKRDDRKLSKEFYQWEEGESKNQITGVTQVPKHEIERLKIVPISSSAIVKKISEQDQSIEKQQTENQIKLEVSGVQRVGFDGSGVGWKVIPQKEKSLLKKYFSAAAEAKKLREVVQAESGQNGDVNQARHFKKWQAACAIRNEAAYGLKPALCQENIQKFLKGRSIYYIELQAKKHEESASLKEALAHYVQKMQDIEGQLKHHIQPLLFKLFPDGPSSKTAHAFRFGSQGSLAVSHSGPKAGQFYDFENREGGGMVDLIRRELNLTKKEARAWVEEFLGIAGKIQIPEHFKRPHISPDHRSEWMSVKPTPRVPAPDFKNMGKLNFYYDEVARYPYRDGKGDLLHYVVRLQSKSDPTRKITPPLSYGCFKGDPHNLSWQYKGYGDGSGKRPLYGLDRLTKKPLSPVLVVEGEKTADRALEKFPDRDLVCITWSGGASSVAQADWSPLFGRKVMVWPDNDKAGFRAAREVCDELKKICPKQVSMVEGEWLFGRLPQKWDLADELPKGWEGGLAIALPGSRQDLFHQSVFSQLEIDRGPLTKKLQTARLLSFFEKRTSEDFNRQLEKCRTVMEERQLFKEYCNRGADFILEKEKIDQMVASDPDINASGQLGNRVAYQAHLYQGKYGTLPTASEILKIKQEIEGHTRDLAFLEKYGIPQDIKDLAINRALEKPCDLALGGSSKVGGATFKNDVFCGIEELSKQECLKISQNKAKEQEIGKEQGLCR